MIGSINEITAAELQAMRDGQVPHQLIDLREPYEAELCTIGGTLIPMAQIVERCGELRRDVPVVMHCRSGNRAAAVVQALSSRYGFSNLHNLQGGIMAFAADVDSNIFCD
jgi:sulfur-carrier protein adenylyltransferase/sulfurtransferase